MKYSEKCEIAVPLGFTFLGCFPAIFQFCFWKYHFYTLKYLFQKNVFEVFHLFYRSSDTAISSTII